MGAKAVEERKELNDASNALLLALHFNSCPLSPARLTFAHAILRILATPIEEEMKSDGKKGKE